MTAVLGFSQDSRALPGSSTSSFSMCRSVDGPEAPLGQDLTLIRPQYSPFTRLRITLEPPSLPRYKGTFSRPGV